MALLIAPRVTVAEPPTGVALREPFPRGLVAAFAPGLGAGLSDLVAGLPLVPANAASLSVGGGTAGLVCSGTTANASQVCPSPLKLLLPLTIVARLSFVATPSVNATLFGVTASNA